MMSLQGCKELIRSAFRALLSAVSVLAPVAETVGAATGNPEVVAGAAVADAAAKVATQGMDATEEE